MINKPFDKIEEADIIALIQEEVREGKTIEYKSELPGGGDEDKKEFLYDVSSFANASGGDIIYGMTEKRDNENKATGLPEKAIGIPDNIDKTILRLEQMLNSSVEPRMPGIQMRAIGSFEKGSVLLIRIPKSWRSPHMITSTSRFYSRTSAGKQKLDVSEIRTAFALSESISEKIRNFRDNRLSDIIAGETPVAISEGLKYVLHVIPLSSYTTVPALNMTKANIRQIIDLSTPLDRSVISCHRINYHGLVFHSDYLNSDAYLQVFRNGTIEVVLIENNFYSEKKIASIAYEKDLIDSLSVCLSILNNLIQATLPIFVLLTLVNAKGYNMYVDPHRTDRTNFQIDRDTLILPDLTIESYDEKPERTLRPAFDMIWQSMGRAGSLNYDENGNWRKHR